MNVALFLLVVVRTVEVFNRALDALIDHCVGLLQCRLFRKTVRTLEEWSLQIVVVQCDSEL